MRAKLSKLGSSRDKEGQGAPRKTKNNAKGVRNVEKLTAGDGLLLGRFVEIFDQHESDASGHTILCGNGILIEHASLAPLSQTSWRRSA